MPSVNSMHDLLTAEIKDLYSAEKQIAKALPKMIESATNPELKAAFQAHLLETKSQITRLEQATELLNTKATGKTCKGMEGVLEEGAEAISEKGNPSFLDLGIIGAACRVEHYEMAGYTTAIALAEQLGQPEVVELLSETLEEESACEEGLRDLMVELMGASELDDEAQTENLGSMAPKLTLKHSPRSMTAKA